MKKQLGEKFQTNKFFEKCKKYNEVIEVIIPYRKCILCNKTFEGYGNNPEPLSFKRRCCDTCNSTKVIPARLKQLSVSNFKQKLK